MPSVPLPEHASFEHLRSQAKLVRDLVRQRDDGGLDMVAEFHPRHDAASVRAADFEPTSIRLADAQLVVARLYGFDRWADLRTHLDLVEQHKRSPGSAVAEGRAGEATDPHLAPDTGLAAVDEFVALACLDYGSDNPLDRLARARAMLAAEPELATASTAAMATVGAFDDLSAAIRAEPDLVTADLGPHRWPLLLYSCYSRVFTDRPHEEGEEEGEGTVRCARLLLELGADPDAGFLWNGLVPPFTALTGVLGYGEQNQPPHPRWPALARALLEAGADPNDGQTLYNNGPAGAAHDDPAFLELLVEFGLGTDQGGAWYRRLGSRLPPPERLLLDELEPAAMGRPNRMRFLVGLGLPLDRPVGRSGLPPVRIAARGGHGDVLAVLADAGVDITLQPDERFLSVVKTGSVDDLRALAAADPELVHRMQEESPGLVAEITSSERLPMIEALLTLGFDLNAFSPSGRTTLHKAATADDASLVEALLALGADPTIEDAHIGATPLDWARHFHSESAADALARHRPA